MVKEEWKEGVAILKSAYTSPNFLPDALSWNVWLEGLKDLPYEVVKASIVVYMQSNHFPPAIADLREIASRFMPEKKELTDMEAWALVSRAVSNSAYNSESEFERLPESVKMAVGDAKTLRDWSQLEESIFGSVAQSQFLRTYRSVQTREKESARLSLTMRQALGLELKETNKIESHENLYIGTDMSETEYTTPDPEKLAKLRAMLMGE